MEKNRREFLKYLFLTPLVILGTDYNPMPRAHLTLLFTADLHSQLLPSYVPEPASAVVPENLKGLPGTYAGREVLKLYKIPEGSKEAYALSCLDFEVLSYKYGKMGGVSYLAYLIKTVREEVGPDRVLLLDGGDALLTGTFGLLTAGKAVSDWMRLAGYDALVGHWEFSLPRRTLSERLKELSEAGCEFLSYNVYEYEGLTESRPFRPYTVKEAAGVRVGIIGSSYPFLEETIPRRVLGNLSSGIREETLRETVRKLREKERVDLVVLLSHNGLLIDLALAKVVDGIDLILSAHSHDVLPGLYKVPGTGTVVVAVGMNGKFLGRLDLKLSGGGLKEISYTLYPVFPAYLQEDESTKALVDSYVAFLSRQGVWEKLGSTESLLYRRDPFFSTWDWLIGDAVKEYLGGELDLFVSPGFRWGSALLPGEDVTLGDILSCTGITFPEVYLLRVRGRDLKRFMEEMAELTFNPDPFLQRGRDMPRFWNVEYSIEINAPVYGKIKDVKVGGKELNPRKEYLVGVFGGIRLPYRDIVDDLGRKPVYEIVADYIKRVKSVKVREEPNVRVLDEEYTPFLKCAEGLE